MATRVVRPFMVMLLIVAAGAFPAATNAVTTSPIEFEAHPTDELVQAIYGLTPHTHDRLRDELHLSNHHLLTMGTFMVERSVARLDAPKADEPDEAMKWRLMQRADANGEIPRGALLDAKRQRDLLVDNNAATEGAGAEWEWLGPGNIGGRTRSILIDPTDADVMYAGSVGGGVWKTIDGGASWSPLTDFIASIAIGCMAMDPNDPQTIYIGTGEGFFNFDAIPGAGIFKTTDGGETFEQLFSTNNDDFNAVNRIAFAPGSSSVMLVATNTGVFRSTNAGQSFTQVETTRTLDVNFSPTDPLRAVAGQDNRVMWSDDGGATWNLSVGASGGGRVEVAFAPSDPAIVFASVQSNGLYKSTNGGELFTNIATQFYMEGQGWYDNIVWVDPTNPDVIVVGGIDLWRTTNGGDDWTRISMWQLAPQSAHADHHYIIEHPQFDGVTNRTVYFANDGGLYRANNVYSVSERNGWQELNNSYGVTQFYGGAGNPLGFGTLVGGTQDNGTLVYIGSTESWKSMFGGDGGFAAADQGQLEFLYGETQWGRVHRTSDAGDTAQFIYFPGIGDANPGTTNFISPIALDPNSSNMLYVGCRNLWRTNNARFEDGKSWSIVHNDVGSNHSAIAIAEGNANVVWVGHNNGHIYKTVNATDPMPMWERVDLNSPPLPDRFVTSFAIDPENHDRVWVSFSGFNSGNVWRTEDGGQTWLSQSGTAGASLPALPVNSVALDPVIEDRVFLATDLGVFVSEDDGMTWSTDNVGPANTVVDQVFFNTMAGEQYVIAVTHGRGMFRLPLNQIFSPPADLNSDGVVDGADLAILLASWGTQFGDVNGDETTDGLDLATLLSTWG